MRECFLENCGIPHTMRQTSLEGDWEEIESCLKRNIPVVLRVDMRYLPYLYNGKYGPSYMSFGWHYVTLFELDAKAKIAKVSDTALSELQSIRLSSLSKARFSETKVYPPRGEYYYFQEPGDQHSVDWNKVARLSLKQYHDNMAEQSTQENQLKGLSGLHQLRRETRDYASSIPSFLVRMVLDVHYGSIETNGTGGAGFRTAYHHFLQKHLHVPERKELLKASENCEQRWHDLASSYKNGAILYRSRSAKKKQEVLVQIAECIEEVYGAEREMSQLIEETIHE